MLKKLLFAFLFALLSSVAGFAQVTTSSITGSVKDERGEALIGATVKATHQPSGTFYGTATNTEGVFNLPNTRIGGPYSVVISYVGYEDKIINDITLRLGQPYLLNVKLAESGTELQEVVISADRSTLFNSTKTGAATNVDSRQIATLPTISRSISDLTRTTPQANGNSFAGRDARYNNIQVDGANLNNNFGLSSDPLPGGGGQPISLDAYEEISINIAPFDVRQSGFTGAGINAVTKSGTNTFKGTAYTYYRDQSFNGTRIGDTDIRDQITDSRNQIYGGSLGGPIIKNKLFFFVNGEYEKGTQPGVTFSPTGGSGSGNVSSTTAADLQTVSNYLRTKFGYETGAFDNFPNFGNQNYKLLGKLDWNINNNHKFTLKYSDFSSNRDANLNGSSVPNGGGFRVDGRTTTVTRLPQNRFSLNSMSFENSNFAFRDIVKTGTAELNSNFGGNMSNQVLATVSRIRATRNSPGGIFPTIDIFNGAGDNYISAGTDPFTNNNDVINNVYSLTNNFTYYLGKHTFTAGASYEYQRVGNMFMPASNSYYAFNSLDDFLNDRAPAYYAYTKSVVPGQAAVYSAELKVGQFGIYVQDEINVKPGLNVTLGVRADKAIYLEQPLENPSITSLNLLDKNGDLTNYSTANWPNSKFLFSPRAGFRWDVQNNGLLVVRGGTGLFTGRIPFVYLTNMPTNSGMYQFGGRIVNPNRITDPNDPRAQIRLNANPDAYADLFPSTPGGTVPPNIVVMDPNFQFPQVFRSNLAVDRQLGNGFGLTLEALFTKDINAVRMRNANQVEATGFTREGDLSRERIIGANRIDGDVTSAIVLENTSQGYSSAFTAQLTKSFSYGLSGSLAYTYTLAKDVTANPGSQAASVWNANPNVGTSNAQELGFSAFAVPHRVVANLAYTVNYAKHFATTVSVFYQGSHQNNYSFVVNGDMTGDGNNATNLMYIPVNASDLRFEQYTATVNGELRTFTPEQQAAAFEQFIENSPYLRNNRGQFAERNAALLPWYNRLDLRLMQDFYINAGAKKHTFQLTADILNAPNLINRNWGALNRAITNNPLIFRSYNEDNVPLYRYQNIGGELVTEPFQKINNLGSTWSMQVGLRYIF
jgi:hypothetical protein